MPNMNDLLRQATVMRNKLARIQEEAKEKTFEASSGGGMVKVVVSGAQELKQITIDPKVFAEGDVEMLQDLISAAVNEGQRIAKESVEREMSTLSNGIHIPGLF